MAPMKWPCSRAKRRPHSGQVSFMIVALLKMRPRRHFGHRWRKRAIQAEALGFTSVVMASEIISARLARVEARRLPAAVDALDPVAVQAEHAVEAAPLPAGDARRLVRQAFQNAHVLADLLVEQADGQPAKRAHATGRAGPARLDKGKRHQARFLLVDGREE